MQQSHWSLYLLAIFMLGLDSKLVGQAFQPDFAEPLTNLTVTIGRDATFRCLVHNLGGYRVGWVKADTKAIQAIHVHVITNNHRVGVSHNGQTVWNLHIRDVREEDRGQYMCQINTDPMKSQFITTFSLSQNFCTEISYADAHSCEDPQRLITYSRITSRHMQNKE